MKHVLIIDHTAGLGGAEYSLESLVKSMDSNRYRYTVALPSPGPFADRLKNNGIQVDFVRLESWRWWIKTPQQKLKYFLTLPLQIISLIRWLVYLQLNRPGLIHFNINRIIEPVLAAKILGIHTVMHFRDIPSRIDSHFIFGLNIFYKIMNLADLWIANSSATFIDIKSKRQDKIFNIPNGIDLENFDLLSAKNKDYSRVNKSKITVAMIALLVPWKNHVGLLKLASIITEHYKNIELLIVGNGELDYRQKLEEIIHNFEIEDHVKFLGYQNNIPALLNSVDILIHTTEKEPFGRVFLEAMAARKPVVAFNSGGASEIVVNGETGILVPNGEIDAMAQAVLSLIDDPVKRKNMGEAGRKRVVKLFSISRHVENVERVYKVL